MIIVVKQNSDKKQFDNLVKWVKNQGVETDISVGKSSTVLGLVGDTSKIDIDLLRSLDIVEDVKRIQEPYKCANRKFHPEDTIVNIGGVKFGGDNFQIIAGPCSVESEKQIVYIAEEVKKAGASVLRGGAFSNGPADCRSAFRYGRPPEDRSGSFGVRLVLSAGIENGR